MCVSIVDLQSENRRGNNKRKKKEEEITAAEYNGLPYWAAIIKQEIIGW